MNNKFDKLIKASINVHKKSKRKDAILKIQQLRPKNNTLLMKEESVSSVK